MNILSHDELVQVILTSLGLSSTNYTLGAKEAIACALRRASGFLCPSPPGRIVSSVIDALEGLEAEAGVPEDQVADVLDELVAYGDLQEHAEVNEPETTSAGRLVYLGPPSFVVRKVSGAALIVGCAEDNAPFLPTDLQNRLVYVGCARRLDPLQGENLGRVLEDAGLSRLSEKHWCEGEAETPAREYVGLFDRKLEEQGPAGAVVGLRILDHSRDVMYESGRWCEPGRLTGRYVARRPRRYGAAIWCYVELSEGVPIRLVDLPCLNPTLRGCDEAWRLQAAIDNCRGHPQRYRLQPGGGGLAAIEVYSSVPQWVLRRWSYLGEEVARRGPRFRHEFRSEDATEEADYLKRFMWLVEAR